MAKGSVTYGDGVGEQRSSHAAPSSQLTLGLQPSPFPTVPCSWCKLRGGRGTVKAGQTRLFPCFRL